jgi:hypothetical protein
MTVAVGSRPLVLQILHYSLLLLFRLIFKFGFVLASLKGLITTLSVLRLFALNPVS